MDGFVTEPTTEVQACLNQAFDFDSSLSLADSFLDFESITEFFENIPPNSDRHSLEKIEFGGIGKSLKMAEDEKTNSGDVISHGSETLEPGCAVKVETLEHEKENNSSCCIEKEMEKVSLVGVKTEIVNDQDDSRKVDLVGGTDLVPVDGSGVKSETVSDEIGSKSSSDSEDESLSSSSSSSSSSSDEEEEKVEVKMEVGRELNVVGELEEGEIEVVDGEETAGGIDDDEEEDDEAEEGEVEMVGGSDIEFDFVGDGDEDGAGAAGGPIKSKNELQVLPPVPQVNVTLQPHHEMLPVGVVLSLLGAQVIVEGVEKHNPLNEGSILWITESRSLLGLIDEIFGPVKNPYYVVRYNSDSEVPAGIHVGTSISFVQEFANHVLNDKNLYKKGYDASGDNDEEVSEAEFSDDEKEAEYRRNLKMEKRGMSDQIPSNKKNNRKKGRNRDGTLQSGRYSAQQMDGVGHLPQNQDQHFSPVPADHSNCSSSSAAGQGFVGGTGLAPQFLPMAGFTTSLNGVWTNGMPSQQPQNAVFPSGFPSNGMPWPPQNYQPHPNQMPMMNSVPFLQQFDPNQRSFPNVTLQGVQPNLLAGPAYAPWLGLVGQNGLNQMIGMGLPGQPMHSGQPGLVGQNGLNQTFGMGFQGQPAPPSINAGEQGIMHNGLGAEQKNFQPIAAPRQFNMGRSSSRGRKPYHRGGGRFAGGIGRRHSK